MPGTKRLVSSEKDVAGVAEMGWNRSLMLSSPCLGDSN